MARRELKQVRIVSDAPVRPGPTVAVTPIRADANGRRPRSDYIAAEEPLEIRVQPSGASEVPAGVTMRTPGNDFELAVGFLAGEGIVRRREDVNQVKYCVGGPAEQQFNVVTVKLRPGVPFDSERLARAFVITSACGVCGKSSLETIRVQNPPLPSAPFVVSADVLKTMPALLRSGQPLFQKTGGMHGAALLSVRGELEIVREDVGRHNAVDKVVGARLLEGTFPVGERVLQVSGRASFEIMQKALMAGIPFVSAVGAPSSLAVSLAEEFGMTLTGFVSEEGFNIYAGAERVAL